MFEDVAAYAARDTLLLPAKNCMRLYNIIKQAVSLQYNIRHVALA